MTLYALSDNKSITETNREERLFIEKTFVGKEALLEKLQKNLFGKSAFLLLIRGINLDGHLGY